MEYLDVPSIFGWKSEVYCWARIRPWCLRSPSTTLPLPQEGLGTWLMRSAASATLPDKSPRRQSSLLKRIDLQVPLAKWLCRFASADYACRSMPTIHGKVLRCGGEPILLRERHHLWRQPIATCQAAMQLLSYTRPDPKRDPHE